MHLKSRHERGQSLLELAALLPFLLWVCMGIVDFGRVYYYDNIAINAARSGARIAANSRASDASVQAAITADINGRLSLVGTPTISPAATYPSGPVYRLVGQSITVTVTYRFRLLTPFVAQVISSPETVSRSATMQVIY